MNVDTQIIRPTELGVFERPFNLDNGTTCYTHTHPLPKGPSLDIKVYISLSLSVSKNVP